MFDSIIRFSLANRALVLLTSFALLCVGIWTALKLPIDVFPDLNAPTVSLLTEAHGMAPEQVELLVTMPIEAAVNGATGVRRVRSSSSAGVSIVHVEFDWDMDPYHARQIVTEKLQSVVGSLPADVDSPIMAPMSSIMGEVMLLAVFSEEKNGEPVVSPMELRSVADWTIKRRLLSIPGVAQVTPIGGDLKEYQINIDPQKMMSFGISMDQVLASARNVSVNASGGVLRENGVEYQIRGLGRAYNVQHIANSVVATIDQVPVLFSDIAEVKIGPGVSYGTASADTQNAVVLTITKQPKADTLKLVERIDEAVEDMKLSLPEGIVFQKDSFRQSDFIDVAIENVLEALRDGALLVVVILFLFLGNFRITFISVIAMPLSVAITFMTFRFFDISLNTMTLGGIAIAIGALVDDAIIDIENVYRCLRRNFQLPESSRLAVNEVVFQASKEIRKPMISATLIITIVFLPLFFLSGVEGRLLQPMGMAYILSIFASLLIALTVTPVMASVLLRSESLYRKNKEGWIAGFLKPIYASTLRFTLRNRWLAGVIAILLLLSAALIAPKLGRAFLPEFNEGALTVTYVTMPGTSLDVSSEMGLEAERKILEVDGVLSVQRRTGRGEVNEHALSVNAGEIEVVLDIEHIDREQLMTEVRDALAEIPGVQFTVGQPISHRIDHMLSGTRASIAVKLFGQELTTLRRIAQEVEEQMESVDGVVDLAIEPVINSQQIAIRFNREAMAMHGISSGEMAELVDAAFAGESVGRVIEGQQTFDIVVRYGKHHRDSLDSLKNALVKTSSGTLLPMSDFASVEHDLGPNQIGRENSQRKLVVQANVADRDLGSVIAEIRQNIADHVDLPEGYFIDFGGQFESEQAASKAITMLSIVSLVFIVLILFYEFRNVGDTLLALINLPLALIGGIWAVFLTGGIVSVASLVGFITLFGIAARNGILLISHYQNLRNENSETSIFDTVMQGSLERLNPILMTALTAGLALIPLALGQGEPGKEIQAPMAIVILGGLITSTFLNMYVVPSLYLFLSRHRNN